MRWQGGRRSDNIDDRRGGGGGGGAGIGRVAVGGGGCLMVAVVVGVGLLFGASPTQILQLLSEVEPQAQTQQPRATPRPAGEDVAGQFVSVVLADTEDVWTQQFAAAGSRYQPPKLVLFDGTVTSACGRASAASGPFYCPGDMQVYLDTSFFRELDQRFGAPGDFAAAYVIAHEVGHHVQRLTGVSQQVNRLQATSSKTQANALSVLQELQADCYAGVWAHHAQKQRQLLEEGDVEEGLRAAAAIGDDRLQRMGRGTVVPESFTHGSSAQRVTWFKRGLQTGDIAQCDTFTAGGR